MKMAGISGRRVIDHLKEKGYQSSLAKGEGRLVERAIDYRWSSARIWQRCASEDESLMVDIDPNSVEKKGIAPITVCFRKVKDLPHIRRQSRDDPVIERTHEFHEL